MPKQISIKLKTVQYGGDSIGQDIRIETQIQGQVFTFDQRIKRGAAVEIDREIASFSTDAAIFETIADVKVIEKDFLFNDVGSSSANLRIDTQINQPQEFNIEVKVRERRKIFRKSTAVFTVTLQVQVFEQSNRTLRPYNSPNSNQNYNRFNQEITQAVTLWNDEFARQKDPPPTALDPNLVKAVVYVESVMGYYKPRRKDAYPGFPDVMQVADPANPAIHVLHDDGKEPAEYEVINGNLQKVSIPEANGDTPAESIKWGTRWLYRKAQKNIQEGSQWRRGWKTWYEAVEQYNSRKSYLEDVKKLYEKGVDPRSGYNLWSILVFLLLASALIFPFTDTAESIESSGRILGRSTEIWQAPRKESIGRILNNPGPMIGCEVFNKWQINNNMLRHCSNISSWQDEYSIKKIVLESYNEEELREIEDIEVKIYDGSVFLAIIESQKDWWEDLEVGRLVNGSIKWLEIENPPTENSILSARFVNLKGFDSPILEVYGETHMGNGNLYLYKVDSDKLSLIFKTYAVDEYYNHRWAPENYKKYGYGTCSEIYRGGKLLASYNDLNNDGVSDIVLTGITDIICEQEKVNEAGERPEVKVSELPAKFTHYISNSRE